jgi:hypothetical protein
VGNEVLVPVGALLLAAGVLPAVAALRLRGAAVFVAAAGVVGASEIVLISIILSLVHGLRVAPMLGARPAVAAVALTWWSSGGRCLPCLRPCPRLPGLVLAVAAVISRSPSGSWSPSRAFPTTGTP